MNIAKSSRRIQEFSVRRQLVLQRIFLVVILLGYLLYLPKMWQRAWQVNEALGGTVLRYDDRFYHVLAVNLSQGLGYSDRTLLPLETYSFELLAEIKPQSEEDVYRFYWAPGLPLMLASAYSLFGNNPLVARYLLVVLIWISGLMLALTGYLMAGSLGVLAGGLTGYYYMSLGGGVAGPEGFYAGRILSEPVCVFWLSLLCFFFTLYLRKKQLLPLLMAGFCLVGVAFARGNFITALPFFYLYLFFKEKRVLWRPILFVTITLLPFLGWSAYASSVKGKFIFFSTQSEYIFPMFNNMEVITGFGPEKINIGNYQPGFAYTDTGILYSTDSNAPDPGENGWVKGFKFWVQHPEMLPRLFYVKLRACFWYRDDPMALPYTDGRVYMVGVGFLLLGLGFRNRAANRHFLTRLTLSQVLMFQLFLIVLLLFLDSLIPFYLTLSIWVLLLIIALLRPYGSVYRPQMVLPSWYLLIIASYLFTTLLFGGYQRYHFPIDPPLMLFSFLGLFTLFIEMWKKEHWLAVFSFVLTAQPLSIVFAFVIDRFKLLFK